MSGLLGSLWVHPGTGAIGRVTATEGRLGATTEVTLTPEGHPSHPADEWPFPVHPNFIDDGTGGPYRNLVLCSYDVEPIRITVGTLRRTWLQPLERSDP